MNLKCLCVGADVCVHIKLVEVQAYTDVIDHTVSLMYGCGMCMPTCRFMSPSVVSVCVCVYVKDNVPGRWVNL